MCYGIIRIPEGSHELRGSRDKWDKDWHNVRDKWDKDWHNVRNKWEKDWHNVRDIHSVYLSFQPFPASLFHCPF
jgi:hypothetical protein